MVRWCVGKRGGKRRRVVSRLCRRLRRTLSWRRQMGGGGGGGGGSGGGGDGAGQISHRDLDHRDRDITSAQWPVQVGGRLPAKCGRALSRGAAALPFAYGRPGRARPDWHPSRAEAEAVVVARLVRAPAAIAQHTAAAKADRTGERENGVGPTSAGASGTARREVLRAASDLEVLCRPSSLERGETRGRGQRWRWGGGCRWSEGRGGDQQ